jgi:Rieske Fe-S protein
MPDHPPTPGETPDGSADLSDLWVSSGRAGGGDAAGEAGGKAVESGAGDVKARGEAWNEAAAADVPTESPAGDQAAEPLDVPSEVSAGATATPPAVEAPGEAVSAVVVPSTADELTGGEPTAESASAAAAAATLPLEPPTAEPISVPVAPDAEAVAVEAISLPAAEPAMKEPAALPRAIVTAAPPSPEGVGATASPEAEARREFLKKALAVMAGGVAVGVPVAIAVRAFTDPLGGTAAAVAGFLPITTLDALKDEGRPYSFPVVADKTDAWNKYRNVRVGAVYLIRHDKDVAAFTAVCPHAGCFVDVAAPGGPEMFRCPCHRSSFAADGSVVPGSVSPRGLDRLDVDPEALKRGEVRVRFQNFVAGTADKVPVG